MGSTQSHHTAPSSASRRSSSPENRRNRPSALRRLSTLTRRRSDDLQLDRHRSTESTKVDPKPLVDGHSIQDIGSSGSNSQSPAIATEVVHPPFIPESSMPPPIPSPTILGPPIPSSRSPPFNDPPLPQAVHSPSGNHSPRPDPPRPDSRRSSLVAESFRRHLSLPHGANEERSMGSRITALLGLSNPTLPQPPASAPVPNQPDPEDMSVGELQARLNRAREDLAETQRLLSETQARIDAAERRRIPQGAVLVIQGLAQTHTVEDEAEVPGSPETTAGEPSRPQLRHMRRSSEGSAQRLRPTAHNGSSLEMQARMIGGLLTVTAAATATTLLSPHTPQPTSTRSTATSAIENIISRIRPRSPQSIESMLGNYLRNVLRDNRRLGSSQAIASQASDDAAEMNVSNEFQSFLETLQGDLVRAVREFAGRPPSSEPVVSPNESDPAASTSEASEINDSAPTVSEAIPAFHHQLGQNVRGMERTSGVTGGVDGAPRRLNFFRAHTFPEVPAGGAENDPNAVVPCIFIAVRSISHDPAFTTEDLVQHPSFPFIDGHVPSAGETGESDMNATSNSAADAIASTPTPAPRTFRQRVMSRLSSTRQPNRPTGPLNTYLVSVIGGNYPRSHPVLAIPNLLTGGPLTDEEMQLVGELMGPVKPLTATTAEIEKAGLRIIDGSETAELAEKGDLLSSCVERCLICLSEYEAGEECRVLNCRHGYHKDCVDQWLSKGSNSCPACRTEAVDKSKITPPLESAVAGPSSVIEPAPSSATDTDM